MQLGFMLGCRITDVIFILLHTRYQLSNKKDISLMFVGLKKVFDPVLCTVLSQTMRALGVEEWVISSGFFIGIYAMKQPLRSMKLQEKNTKRLKSTQNLFPKNLKLKVSLNSRLKAIQFIGQRKAFYKQNILELSYARKETIATDILVTSRNTDRKICNLSE